MKERLWTIAIGAALLLAMVVGGVGGFGFFATPDVVVEAYPGVETLEGIEDYGEPIPPVTAEEAGPCNGQPGNTTRYYANEAQYNNFGPPLDPALSPLDNPQDPEPDVHEIVDATWERLCQDPALTRAIVAAAFPTWDKLDVESFDWKLAVEKLTAIDWSNAELVYYTEPPTPWTMMMKQGEPNGPPTIHITEANHAGWYLYLAVDGSNPLLLRLGCGGQPSLDLTEGAEQTVLADIF